MGTSGAWGGSGSAAAKALRQTIAAQSDPTGAAAGPAVTAQRLAADDLRDAVRLLDTRTSATGGGSTTGAGGSRTAAGSARRSRTGGSGGSRGGARRSTARTAGAAGRAIAGAIAYRAGDRATLTRLGLDLDALTRLGDPFEVIRRIVDMACGNAESTVEDHERRLMAAYVAEQLVTDLDFTAGVPTAEIAALAASAIIAEMVLSESGDILLKSDGTVTEQDVRDAATAIVDNGQFTVQGVTESDFATAIETGLDQLRTILGID